MASLSLVKKQNTVRILKAMRLNPKCTKPLLQQKCELTASTVHGIISQLEEKKVIQCYGNSHSNGGRKASIYRINPEYKYIISVCVRMHVIKIEILDFNFKIIQQNTVNNNLKTQSVDSTIKKIVKHCNTAIKKCEDLGKNISGVGVTIPGPVDSEKGVVLSIPGTTQWVNIDLKKHLASNIDANITVEKDLNAGMKYLLYHSGFAKNKSTVCLSVCDGIAAGILIGNSIYAGVHSLAGELGHISMPYEGRKCHCGNTDCLELYASDVGVLNLYNEKQAPENKLDNILQLIAKAQSGDAVANEIFRNATKFLTQAIFNIILTYDPNEILISCSWIYLFDTIFFEQLDNHVKNSVFSAYGDININIINIDNFYTLGSGAMVAFKELDFSLV